MEKIVNSLYRGLQILRSFSPEEPKLRLIDIIRKTDLPKTTVIRLLRTLESFDYVNYDPDSKRYNLGPKVISFGFKVLSNTGVSKTFLPHMRALANAIYRN